MHDDTHAATHAASATGTEPVLAEAPAAGGSDELLVDDELLVEEVSIDGMCGVY